MTNGFDGKTRLENFWHQEIKYFLNSVSLTLAAEFTTLCGGMVGIPSYDFTITQIQFSDNPLLSNRYLAASWSIF